MKIVVPKDEIQEKLSNIQNIVEKRNTMPIISHFLLEAGKKESFITATDLETALREPVNVTAEKEGRICIPARKMFEIVREVDGDITAESVDEQWLKIKAGASSFRLACLPAKEFPTWPTLDDTAEIAASPALLKEVIEKTIYATGESDTRYTLNGLLFHLVPGAELTVVGTDGHRLALFKKQIEGTIQDEQKLIIPKKAANELRKLLDKSGEGVRIRLGKNHVLFVVGEIEFLTRLIEGTYPNYDQVIPSTNDKKAIIPRDELSRVLRRVSIMSKERSSAVKFDLAPGKIVISSSNPDLGDAQDEITVQYSDEEMSLGFNARYFLDIVESMASEKVIMELQGPLSPVLMKEETEEHYRCVLMPMRI